VLSAHADAPDFLLKHAGRVVLCPDFQWRWQYRL
jgi:hypothetical protein